MSVKKASSPGAVNNDNDEENASSLRSWLAKLEKADQLSQIDCEVDSNLEVGAITRINLGLAGPALQFNNIKDYQGTISTSFVTCAMSNKKQLCMLLDLPEATADKDIVSHLKNAYNKPLAPNMVNQAAHKENIIKGDDIDLAQFPAPVWHELDGFIQRSGC
jgi:4-hydroxy-3-polyprenylbenzoate decarboxylase